MNQDTTPLNHISIDLEQWRSDISTFVDTTSQALNAIISELSGSCSVGFSSSINPTHRDEILPKFESHNAPSTNDASQDERLEKLKSQLAQRISQSI